MAWWLVELRGDVREVYTVEADTAEEAEANWANGSLEFSEASNMGVETVRADE